MRLAPRLPLIALVALAVGAALPAPAAAVCPNVSVVATAANAEEVAAAVVCAANDARSRFGLPLLRSDARLARAAVAHSADMARRDYFDHSSPEGVGPGERAAAQGYPGGFVAENIFAGVSTAAEAVEGWMGSEGHCSNILDPGWLDLGIGLGFGGSFGRYWTLKAGREPGARPPSSNRAPQAACPHRIDVESGDFTGGGGGGGGPALPVAQALQVRVSGGRRSLVVRGTLDPALAGQRVIVRAGRGRERKSARGLTREAGAFTVSVARPRGRRIPLEVVFPASAGRFSAGRFTTTIVVG